MTTALDDKGVQFATNNILNIATAVPTTGSYTLGDIVYEKTANTTQSGWKRLTTGSGHVLGTDWIYFQQGLTASTAQNTTSGTSIDFTGIPSWAKRITVMFNGVSTNGTALVMLQMASGGSVETSGYTGFTSYIQNAAATVATAISTSFPLSAANAATSVYDGIAVFALSGSNKWAFQSTVSAGNSQIGFCGGSKTLTTTLDRIRLTTANGTDVFDAGSVNIMWE